MGDHVAFAAEEVAGVARTWRPGAASFSPRSRRSSASAAAATPAPARTAFPSASSACPRRARCRRSTSGSRSGSPPRAARSARAIGGYGTPRPSCSSSNQAAPMPSWARPPERTSSVVTVFASRPGVAVGDAGDQQAEAHPLGLRGDVAEGGVALQHRFGVRADRRDLEPVVHQGELVGAALLGGAGGGGEDRRDVLRAAGVGERGVVDRELQRLSFRLVCDPPKTMEVDPSASQPTRARLELPPNPQVSPPPSRKRGLKRTHDGSPRWAARLLGPAGSRAVGPSLFPGVRRRSPVRDGRRAVRRRSAGPPARGRGGRRRGGRRCPRGVARGRFRRSGVECR